MPIAAHILQRAMELYLSIAYPSGAIPAGVEPRVNAVRALDPGAEVPASVLETEAANALPSYALRLGQPLYPNMKLVLDPAPGGGSPPSYLIRADAHDRHLHAPAGSPDAAWLESIRKSNQDLTQRIEAAWSAAGLPTFKDFLRRQLQARKAGATPPPAAP